MASSVRSVAAPIVAILAFGIEPMLAQTTARANIATGGAQSDAVSIEPSISADGRFLAFRSLASTLVAGDTNGVWDIFVRDRQSGTTERVSISSTGAQQHQPSGYPSLSADGRFIAFASNAAHLVSGDTNAVWDVFVRDRATATNERASLDTAGAQGNLQSLRPAISADGRCVAYESFASNLVAGDTNGVWDIFLRDRVSGTTERVSVSTSGGEGNDYSETAALSADGRFVAFASFASNLVANDTNASWDVFVRDRISGTTECASVNSIATQGNSNSQSPSISADGRFVAFESISLDLIATDTNGVCDIYVHDRIGGTTERVSVDSNGMEADSESLHPSISADGRFVAFESLATNLVAGDTNGVKDVFVHDRLSGTTERVSVDSNGAAASGASEDSAISGDTRFVAFVSMASNLVAGDSNAVADVFTHDRGAFPPASYCTAGTTTNGCDASIAASANPSLTSAHPCSITVTRLEGLKSGLLFYGLDNTSFSPSAWASGSTSLLCVKPPTQRTPIQNSGGTFNACDGSLVLDWNAFQQAHPLALGSPWVLDSNVYLQAWLRDPLAVKSTNLSNAVHMTYVP